MRPSRSNAKPIGVTICGSRATSSNLYRPSVTRGSAALRKLLTKSDKARTFHSITIRSRTAMNARSALFRFVDQLQRRNDRVMIRRPMAVVARTHDIRGDRLELARMQNEIDSRTFHRTIPVIEARFIFRTLAMQFAKAIRKGAAGRIIRADKFFHGRRIFM